ncbi:putative lipid II flippase FtsW [Aneurinibacillus migulanus]|uniref:putative lipid II flippase FtsW n=1 Tax=Aneurinibacillus migulanus TaxID=47500 RepID=UPI0020A1E25B|nr:putative lipid II flippase FtsW [Aneurinibacillus migulanus]MCP1357649.1 putative lipid II flippase FtsW [Aneurinibacillus migulanus]MED4729870.1 putative lipid II flippase FtsW [Aneurinibacillus migulanus]
MKNRGRPDFTLLLLALILVGFGIIMVYSSSSIHALSKYNDDTYFVKGQIIRGLLGTFVMLIVMNIPYQFYKKYFLHILALTLLLLLVVLIPGIGVWRGGARSWLNLGVILVQPSEIAKISLIIYLAAIIAKKKERFLDFKTGFSPAITVIALFFLLIAIQPDFGSAAILSIIAASVLYVGGARLKHLAIVSIPLLLFSTVYILLAPYRLQRLLIFRDPWADEMDAGYQLVHSFSALAHGGMTGTGLGKSIEKYLYLPEAQTDFIFAIIGEEFGFIGVTLFLLTYVLFIWRIIIISLRSEDTFSKLVGIGIASMLFVQSFINIGGVTGLIPLTGVTLPLISYGGSSLIITMVSIGIVLGISREIDKAKIQKIIDRQKFKKA